MDQTAAPPPQAGRTARPGVQTALASALTVLLGVVALTSLPLVGEPAYAAGPALPWPVLALVFAVTEAVVLHVQVRREAQTVSLSELVTVVALFLAPPVALVASRALAGLGVCVLHRRESPLKTAFNTALFAAEASVALHVFRLVAGSDGGLGPRAWLAACLAALVSGVFGTFVVQLVLAVYDGELDLRDAVRESAAAAGVLLFGAVVALLAVLCLTADRRSIWLLLVPAAGLLLAYRAYARLSDQHLSLERLYRFSQVVTSSPEVDAVLRSVLVEAAELLRVEEVLVRFLPAVVGRAGLQVRLGPDGALERTELPADADPGWLHEAVVAEGRSVLLDRGTRSPLGAAWLAAHGHREAVVVPMRGEAGVIGTLRVADRTGEVRAFDAGDVLLLETVASHAGKSLQNGRLVDQLRHDALHDGLTGLPNRVHLQQVLTEAVQEVAAGRREGATVMVLDLDGFKDVNDTLGHESGDRLLEEVSRRLRAAVGPAGFVARLGGDEFALLLTHTAAQPEVLAAGGQVLQALREPVLIDGMPVTVGGSLGIALAPMHGTEGPALLKCADLAMYGAKASAGGMRVYHADLDSDDPRRVVLVRDLRSALHAGLLDVHLQPIVELASGRVRSVEALVRWSHPDLGDVPPDELVPAAERSGLIGPLTTFVLDRALAACAAWRAAGLEHGVSVNLSTRSLVDAAFVAEVGELLARHQVPGALLTLEITEGVVMSDTERAVVLMAELRALGVRLSLDDFGTGYSSLAYLTRLPVDEIKIDKSFVRRLGSRSDDVAVVRSIAELGRGLRLDVVAEGVEDAQTCSVLQALGCTHGQGWQLGRPMPLPALLQWLAAGPTRVLHPSGATGT